VGGDRRRARNLEKRGKGKQERVPEPGGQRLDWDSILYLVRGRVEGRKLERERATNWVPSSRSRRGGAGAQ
jgi:hypothetical protein